MAKSVPDDVRAAVLKRCAFRCERCGLRMMTSLHMSHRQPRGMGGSKSKTHPHHRLSNVNALCPQCHLRFVEANPRAAEAEGFRVPTGVDVWSVACKMWDGWFLIHDSGTRSEVAEPLPL